MKWFLRRSFRVCWASLINPHLEGYKSQFCRPRVCSYELRNPVSLSLIFLKNQRLDTIEEHAVALLHYFIPQKKRACVMTVWVKATVLGVALWPAVCVYEITYSTSWDFPECSCPYMSFLHPIITDLTEFLLPGYVKIKKKNSSLSAWGRTLRSFFVLYWNPVLGLDFE